jgi:molybdopterin converting factor small subunit
MPATNAYPILKIRQKEREMSVKVNIVYPHLKQLAGNQDVVNVDGNTVAECLDHLISLFPAVKENIFDRQGKLLNFVYFFINGKGFYPPDLTKTVGDGDEVTIALLLAGG